MVLEVVVLWAIVIGTVVWFVRDERRQKADAALQQQASTYAHAPRYRHVTVSAAPVLAPVAVPATPALRTGGLTDAQRRFIKAYAALD